MMAGALLVLAAFCASLVPAQNATQVYAIKGARIYTLAGAPIENGTVVIRDGKIAAVGANVDVPAGAQTVDATGLEVYPGMFDALTQMGLDEVSAVRATVDVTEVGDYNPDVVAATAVNPASAHIPVARASGITHVIAAPGTSGFDAAGGGIITGQASAFNMAGWTMDEMQIRRSVAMVINWPTLDTRSFDFSTFSIQEKAFADVKKEYDRKIDEMTDWMERARHYAQAKEKGSAANFERDLKLEALLPVVEGQLPVLVVAGKARDIRNAVDFCTKQNLRMILADGSEAWKVKDLLKDKKIPVILSPTLSLPDNEDTPYDREMEQASELHAAGIPIAFSSFGVAFSRRLSQYAGAAVAYGLPHDEALNAVTINAAQMFGLADQVGTVEPGKMANLIVTNGDPLEIKTEVRYLFIDGRLTSTDNRHRDLYEEYRKRPQPAK